MHNASFISRDGLYRAGIPARGLGAVVAIDRDVIGRPLNHLYQPGPHVKPMFLLASNFTGVAAHTISLKDQQRDLSHLLFPLLIPAR
jgi:hypothetical protein